MSEPSADQAPEPTATGQLDVGDGHTIYWERCGNADGVPVPASTSTAAPAVGRLLGSADGSTPSGSTPSCSTSGAVAAAGPWPRTRAPTCRFRPRPTWWPTSRPSDGTSVSIAGWSSVCRGARPWLWPTRRPTPRRCGAWCSAWSPPPRPPRSSGSPRTSGPSSPRSGIASPTTCPSTSETGPWSLPPSRPPALTTPTPTWSGPRPEPGAGGRTPRCVPGSGSPAEPPVRGSGRPFRVRFARLVTHYSQSNHAFQYADGSPGLLAGAASLGS